MSDRNINASIFMEETAPVETAPVVEQEKDDKLVDVINFKNLTQIFNKGEENEYQLFNDFSLDIPDFPGVGQLISIMGASGCGKSRMLRALAGLDTIESGEILVYGKDRREYGNIPMVFQTYSNYEWMTVLENVALPMILKGENKEVANKKAMEILEVVGLAEHADKYAKNGVLSGGQLQRISIARCLASNSQIMLLDEATGALDINMKREIQNIILKIFYESPFDPTILNVTHSIEEAIYLSNRVIVLGANPCRIHKVLDIHFPGEEVRNRGPWVVDTPEFAEYTRLLTQYLDEANKK